MGETFHRHTALFCFQILLRFWCKQTIKISNGRHSAKCQKLNKQITKINRIDYNCTIWVTNAIKSAVHVNWKCVIRIDHRDELLILMEKNG